MTKLRRLPKIWLYKYPIDMRKQIDGLCRLVAEQMNKNPQSGDVYVFFSFAANRVKLLFWDGEGFVLIYKRLERGHFQVPTYIGQHVSITQQQLSHLLRGVMNESEVQSLSFQDYY